jgi:hypothetical protein
MKANLLKSYLKYSYKSLIIAFAFLLLLSYCDGFSYLYLIFFPISLIGDYFRFGNKLIEAKKLKAKGLTEEDIHNIQFVKKWEITRKRGIWRYCIIDGGIILGAGLSVVISLIIFIILGDKFRSIIAEPGSMFSFIGYTYIWGAVTGVISYKVLWPYKERRFIRLTDPLFDIQLHQPFQEQ